VLKGLDLALEAFEGLEGVDLHVCGPVRDNEAFAEHYHDLLYETDNIHTTGWVRVGSREFTEVMSEAGYLLYPSASDGFPNGSIAACMHAGLVPVLSPEIVHDTDGWGHTLEEVTVPGIRSCVRRCAGVDPGSLRATSEAALEKARTDITRRAYSSDLEAALRRVLSDRGRDRRPS
jgi:glycosyltransferase involved in cell wall biosynthesis